MTHNDNTNGHDPVGVPRDYDPKGVSKDEPLEGKKLIVVGTPRNKKVAVIPEHENDDNKSDNDTVTVTKTTRIPSSQRKQQYYCHRDPSELKSNQPEDNLDRTMDKQYSTHQPENMIPHNQKSTLPPKLRINLLSDVAKRANIEESNETVHTVSSKTLAYMTTRTFTQKFIVSLASK